MVKHGEPAQAEIRIKISGDGQGFDPATSFDESQGSGGLMNIRHGWRLRRRRGVEVNSQPGQGARVVISIPATQAKD